MSAEMFPGESLADRRERVCRQLDYLKRQGIVESYRWNAKYRRFGIAPNRLSDRFLTLSETEEWVLGAMSAMHSVVDNFGQMFRGLLDDTDDRGAQAVMSDVIFTWRQYRDQVVVEKVAAVAAAEGRS